MIKLITLIYIKTLNIFSWQSTNKKKSSTSGEQVNARTSLLSKK